jgi:D-alanyl-D-alanine carboxypeptidase/D-alanyl-D-alanine-endopeptidase (penicillin-binding protein 4)
MKKKSPHHVPLTAPFLQFAFRRPSSAIRRSLIAVLVAVLFSSASVSANEKTGITSLLKQNDACVLLSPDGRELVSVNGDTPLTPASTLKILTALVGFHSLGSEYRFPTEIYINDDGDLTVKGYGDPMLISEVLFQMSMDIKENLPEGTTSIRNIILDDTYFASPLTIPGVSNSPEPYDAPNGALCANFNTINFKRRGDGTYISGEEQTPLLPAVLDRVRASGLKEGRIPLSPKQRETTGYTGHLLVWFLKQNGIAVTGSIRFSAVNSARDRLLLTFQSPFKLFEVVSALMEHSNNFIANQILVASGARAYNAPGSLEKGVRAARAFSLDQLHLERTDIVEGSGISRKNRITARAMLKVLDAFSSHRSLLHHEDYAYYKTGTLKGIATRAGYLMDDEGYAYPFVVFLNASGENMQSVMLKLKEMVEQR